MKIYEYYRNAANARLNGSMAALVPAIIIVCGNLSFFQNKVMMLGIIPFLFYSFINFQIYLSKLNQSMIIEKNMDMKKEIKKTLFEVKQLLIVYLDILSPSLLLFFPDGYLAGKIQKTKKPRSIFNRNKTYTLTNTADEILATFKVRGRKKVKIEVFSGANVYLGCYEKTKQPVLQKDKKELLDSTGRYIGAVKGSALFMDEQIFDNRNEIVGRLRRGWMPLEWSSCFPDPNTPVLSLWDGFSEKDKLLRLSMLINEYFIER